MDRQEIRNELWYLLKRRIDGSKPIKFTMSAIFDEINGSGEVQKSKSNERRYLTEEINSMILSNILVPMDIGNAETTGYPWLFISEFGEECLKRDTILPFDPDGYILSIKTQISNFDETALQYIKESIICYHKQLYLSSIMCLGISSEQCILLLIDAFVKSLQKEPDKRTFLKKLESRSIFSKFETFKNEFSKYRSILPKELVNDFESMVEGVFNFIRITRNKTGHPKGQSIDRIILHSNLQIFRSYIAKLYQLIKYFESNRI